MKKLMHLLMLSCLRATELIEKRYIGKLTLIQKMQLHMHTSACNICNNYQKQSSLIHHTLLKHSQNGGTENVHSIKPEEIEGLKQNIILQLEEYK